MFLLDEGQHTKEWSRMVSISFLICSFSWILLHEIKRMQYGFPHIPKIVRILTGWGKP